MAVRSLNSPPPSPVEKVNTKPPGAFASKAGIASCNSARGLEGIKRFCVAHRHLCNDGISSIIEKIPGRSLEACAMAFADAEDFIRINYFCILLGKEKFLRVEMPPPDFSADSQIFSFLPFCLCFSNGLGFLQLPAFAPTAGRRWVACREGEIPQSTVYSSRCGSTGFERGFLKGISPQMTLMHLEK